VVDTLIVLWGTGLILFNFMLLSMGDYAPGVLSIIFWVVAFIALVIGVVASWVVVFKKKYSRVFAVLAYIPILVFAYLVFQFYQLF
jgi:hypothetical protein